MDKHTFQVGDRVVDTLEKSKGTIGGKNQYGHWLVLRDDMLAGAWKPYFSYINEHLTHDTDFQVGDWVRYEGIGDHALAKLEGHTGEVNKVTNGCVYVDFSRYETKGTHWRLANLVKIQPPQEAQVKLINIKHEKYGVVEGVKVLQGGLDYGFTKDGAHYFVGNGWSQVPEIEWVTIQVEKKGFDKLMAYDNLYGHSHTAYSVGEVTRWRYPQ